MAAEAPATPYSAKSHLSAAASGAGSAAAAAAALDRTEMLLRFCMDVFVVLSLVDGSLRPGCHATTLLARARAAAGAIMAPKWTDADLSNALERHVRPSIKRLKGMGVLLQATPLLLALFKEAAALRSLAALGACRLFPAWEKEWSRASDQSFSSRYLQAVRAGCRSRWCCALYAIACWGDLATASATDFTQRVKLAALDHGAASAVAASCAVTTAALALDAILNTEVVDAAAREHLGALDSLKGDAEIASKLAVLPCRIVPALVGKHNKNVQRHWLALIHAVMIQSGDALWHESLGSGGYVFGEALRVWTSEWLDPAQSSAAVLPADAELPPPAAVPPASDDARAKRVAETAALVDLLVSERYQHVVQRRIGGYLVLALAKCFGVAAAVKGRCSR